MKKTINVADYAGDFMKALPKGILLTAKADDKVNSMVIGWGTIGVNWGKPVFAVYVRESRFTKELLDKNPEFTVNAPVGEFDQKILAICGSKSGRDIDKVAEAGLTLVDSEVISVPAIKEFPLTLECKVIYRQIQEFDLYQEDIAAKYYPEAPATGSGRDVHYVYFGEIVAAYIAE